jgi:hypothetical protein
MKTLWFKVSAVGVLLTVLIMLTFTFRPGGTETEPAVNSAENKLKTDTKTGAPEYESQ